MTQQQSQGKIKNSMEGKIMKKIVIALCTLLLFFVSYAGKNIIETEGKATGANIVKIEGKKGSWYLTLNGKPFELKGVGINYGYGTYGQDFMKMAKEMGANTVRSWNYTQGVLGKSYLDHAQKNGLYVASWMWLNPAKDEYKTISYKKGSPYRKRCRERVLRWVNDLKNHPALLMWGLGNEVIFFSKSEEEKIAFARFLNELCEMIHNIDPNHPIIYASMEAQALPYLVKYTPELDIIGMNTYSSLISMHKRWEMTGFNKPYILTEFGPVNKWGVSKDVNGLPMDPPDWHKARQYKRFFKDINKYKGYCLGGFVFHLGELCQWTDSWWNLTWGRLKRPSYWVAYEAYTGEKPQNRPPKINSVGLSKQNNIKPFEEITVEVDAEDPDGDSLTIDYDLRTVKEGIVQRRVEEYYEELAIPTESGFKLKAPSCEGTFILYILVKDGHGNVAIANRSLIIE